MKTILYLNHTAVPGGAEFALARLLKEMNPAAVKPVVLLADEGPAADLLRRQGVETHVLPLGDQVREVRKDTLGGGALLHPGRALALVSYARRVAHFAQERGVDIIHTNSMKAHFYGALAGRLSGIPVVWHIRDFVNEAYLPRPAVWGIRMLARILPTRLVTVSRSVLAQMHLPEGSGKGVAIHDGLGEEGMARLATVSALPWSEGAPRIGLIGRLMPWKGQHIFLEAAAQVLRAGYLAEFEIVGAPFFGEEAYEQQLHRQAETLGIAEHVHFRGFQSDIPAVLSRLDIFVHASTSPDPCPNAILEALAAGRPVIGSDGGGVPEIITSCKTGLLAPMGDAGALACQMIALLDDPAWAREMGQAGAHEVQAAFTSARTARQVEGVYDEIVTSRRAVLISPTTGDAHA